jgi:hypothetical protein
MDDILPEISIKVIPGAAASEFLISSALRAGQPKESSALGAGKSFDASRRPDNYQPRSLRRFAPANLSTLRADAKSSYSYSLDDVIFGF